MLILNHHYLHSLWSRVSRYAGYVTEVFYLYTDRTCRHLPVKRHGEGGHPLQIGQSSLGTRYGAYLTTSARTSVAQRCSGGLRGLLVSGPQSLHYDFSYTQTWLVHAGFGSMSHRLVMTSDPNKGVLL